MTPIANASSFDRLRLRALALALMLVFSATLAAATMASPPGFSKEFAPDTIGPGSVSVLTFTINNSDNPTYAVGDLAFSDTLPTGMALAAPAFVSNTCFGTVTAPDGGTTISLTDGMVGAGKTCKIVVNVTASSADNNPHENLSGDLTSDAGNSGPAGATLTVANSLPGFSKSFAPSTVAFGGRSTLTLLIDNSLNGSSVLNLNFTDVLPPGMVVASPSNKSTTCGTATIPPTLTAKSGTSSIILAASGTGGFPAVAAGATCSVMVDVIGGAIGSLGNVSGNVQADFVDAGKAAAVLTVTGFEDLLTIEKDFLDDPVAPGGMVTLRFTITNRSRVDAATGITFSDTIDPLGGLTGIVPTLPPTPNPPCGAGSMLTFGSGALTLTGGTLAPEVSCIFDVKLTLPAGATPGTYTNTTGAVSGDVGGEPETGNTASDLLFVEAFPVLTKEFTDDPVGAGGTVTLEFTITNPGASAMTDIEFLDELTDGSGGFPPDPTSGFLPFPVSVTLPPVPDPPCGAGSSLALVSAGTDRQALELTGGSLAASDGMPGGPDECTFSVTVDIPVELPPGTYTNTTEEITATAAMATVTGPPATDDIVVVAAPQLSKEFTDDPAVPGGMVTLEFTLQNLDPDNAASAIAFSDDLGATLTGLTLTSVLFNDCGGTVSGVGTDMFGYTGGSLAADDGVPDMGPDQCTIRVELTLPGSPPGGTFGNTTSEPTATVAGVAAASAAAEDDLVVAGLQFSKEFVGDPVIAGGMVTLRFTFQNLGTSMADDATGIFFSDNLAAILPGTPDVTKIGGPTVNTCGGTDSGSATFVSYSGGSLGFGSTCTIEYDLLVPVGFVDDEYANVTSSLTATIDGGSVVLPPAVDDLTIQSDILALSKDFIDDPVNPGETVTLEFTLENLSATETVTGIAFDDDLEATLAGLTPSLPPSPDPPCGAGSSLSFSLGVLSLAAGTLGPGGTCTFSVELTVPAGPLPGSVFPNTTSGVIGKVGALDVFGDPASDDLEVDALKLGKAFDGPTTAGGTAVLSFTIENLDSVNGVSGLAFSDNLAAVIPGLVATLPPTPNPPCGAGSTLAGTFFLSLTGGSLAPGGSCTFSVTVTVPGSATVGDFLNKTSRLFDSGIPVAAPATAFLEVEPPPTFAKLFAPDAILIGAVSTLTFTIDNTASALAASALDFTDNLPAGVVVAAPANASTTCAGGTLTAMSGTGVVTYSGGSVPAMDSCEVQVDVTSSVSGVFVNTSGDLTSSSGNSGTANDTLTVQAPPDFTKEFVPNSIVETFDTTLVFTIDNSGSPVAVSDLDFLDTLPFDLVVAMVPAVVNNCGGSVVALPGSTSISLSNGTLAAGATCTISVQINAPSPTGPGAPRVNVSGDLTSTQGNSGMATDELIVKPCAAADGLDVTLTGELVLGTVTVEVCRTVEVRQHYKVDGPNGTLSLTVGVSAVFFNGVEFGSGSTLTIVIDPTLAE